MQPSLGAATDLDESLLDPERRTAFKRSRHGRRQVAPTAPRIPLPEPVPNLRALYYSRASQRRFATRPVPRAQLLGLLTALSSRHLDGRDKYLYGSADDSRGVQTYLYVKPRGVTGLDPGVYYHDPVAGALVLIDADARIDRHFHLFDNRKLMAGAAFELFFVAEMAAIAPLHGDRALRYALIEAGLMTQLLEMLCNDFQLGLCQVGQLDFERARPLLGLGPSHVFLHSLLGGAIDWEEGEL